VYEQPIIEKEIPMIDFILAGLSAGLFAFFTLFVVSFVTLGVITGHSFGCRCLSKPVYR